MTIAQPPTLSWKSGPSEAPIPPLVPGLPLVGSALQMAEDILKFFVKVYHEHGPITRIRVLSDEYTVMAGPEANLFFSREGNDHFRSKEFWEGMDREMGADHSLISLDGAEHANGMVLRIEFEFAQAMDPPRTTIAGPNDPVLPVKRLAPADHVILEIGRQGDPIVGME